MAPRWVFPLLVVAALLAPSASEAKAPRCFGAAARDPLKPCENPQLKRSVTPTPRRAPLIPGSDCTRQPQEGMVVPCAFGATPASARGQFALIGDSHAAHWRPTVTLIAKRHAVAGRGDHAQRVLVLDGRAHVAGAVSRRSARRGRTDVLAWLGRHPEVTTMVLAQKTVDPNDFAPRPLPSFETLTAGLHGHVGALPASVQRVYVIRDNPSGRVSTLTCVERVMAAAVSRRSLHGAARHGAARPTRPRRR